MEKDFESLIKAKMKPFYIKNEKRSKTVLRKYSDNVSQKFISTFFLIFLFILIN